MADDTTRIINLTEATEISDGMYLVTDASTGTRKLSLQKVLDKAGGNVADDYDSTATYDVGDLVVYKGVLYECSTEISTAEAWNPAHWSQINLGDIIADIDGSIEELYEDKANVSGEYDNIVAGTAKQLLSSIYTTNDSPYLFRPTPADSDRERVKRLEGLSVGWNQLCNDSSVTVTSVHKYYMKKASVESIGASDGTALTGLTSGTDMVIDLTILFGSTIADHIYTLEQATEGSGVAWVKQYIDFDGYHPYSAPTIKSVEGLESHVMVGYNQFSGTTKNNTNINGIGNEETDYSRSCTSATRILPNTTYCVTYADSVNNGVFFYDKNMAFISFLPCAEKNRTFLTPSNAAYVRFSFAQGTAPTDICINISDASKNGTYEPYEKHSYPLDSTITLRGVPKLVDGQLKADGDRYEASGDVTVRYATHAIVPSNIQNNGSDTESSLYKAFYSVPGRAYTLNVICDRFSRGSGAWAMEVRATSNGIEFALPFSAIGVTAEDDNMTVKLPAAKTWFTNNVTNLVYELATPTTSAALPYSEVQVCDGNGTEEFVTDSVVPVGNVTEYTADLRQQVENIYGIPPVPEEDGEYTLHATVAEGVKTFTWESES